MANDHLEKELQAVRTIVEVLDPLDEDSRSFVLDTVFRKLNITKPAPSTSQETGAYSGKQKKPTEQPLSVVHIKELKREKNPRSAVEMVTLAAYWQMYRAPNDNRSDTIDAKQAETCFRLASYKLPVNIHDTLHNAKKAGYLDSSSRGTYKLNAIGYNLIEHTLPRGQ
jgi:hypothetical protein